MAHVIENTRLDLQDRLDAVKTQAERNKLGQFATPTALAADILDYAKSTLPRRLKVRFLDPAFGTGSFYSGLLRAFPASRVVQAEGYEIDPHYGEEALRFWDNTPLKLQVADFTRAAPALSDDEKANLLICNPPYVRHHHIPSEEKLRLQITTEKATGIRLSGLAGLYCHFLCRSHAWMAEGGLAGWLIPSEFMDVNYGQAVKQYLLDRVTLLRIHRFDPDDVQFDDALVSSVVVWFRNASPSPNHSVEFSYGGTLVDPKVSKQIPVSLLHKTPKWTRLPLAAGDATPNGRRLKLSDLFTIKRGLATGANEFFMLTQEQVAEHHLPTGFLQPILPSPRYVQTNEIQADDQGNPLIDRRLFLLSCNLPEEAVKKKYPSLWTYLQSGIEAGVSARYLCRHRSPWYSQEVRPPAPLLCTYMGRQGNGIRPFRFILNYSEATATNVYLMLYPKPALIKALQKDARLIRAIWKTLNEIPLEVLLGEGRVYGGGLHKLEPKELGNAPAETLFALTPALLDECAEQISFL